MLGPGRRRHEAGAATAKPVPRSLQISLPNGSTDAVIEDLRGREGVMGLSIQRGAGIVPPGDVITVSLSNRCYWDVMCALERHGIGSSPATSLVTSEPIGVVSPRAAAVLTTDTTDSIWEEMEMTLAKESHITSNTAGVMFVAGFCAGAGIATGALHVVIGAMVIAPGFEPFVRMVLGWITGSRAWVRGLASAAGGYAALILGAACAAWICQAAGQTLLAGGTAYESSGTLVHYWTSLSAPSIAISIAAGIGGSLLILSHRSVLTAGVMIALALVPAAAMVPVALIAGDPERAALAGLRWGVEIALVLATAVPVFLWKRRRGHRKRMLL